MNYYIALLAIVAAALVGLSTAQFVVQQPIAYALQAQPSLFQPVQQPAPIAHPAVVDNAIKESQLPDDLIRSNQFYRNPKTADALAKESWFTDKEMPVFNREAEKIPREQIVKIFKNAGFIHRRK